MPTPTDFSRFDFGKDRAASGEFGQAANAPAAPTPAPGNYPRQSDYGFDSTNSQFSSKLNGEPQELAQATDASQSDFANLQQFLMNNLETPGSRVAHDTKKEWAPPSGAEKDKTPWP